MVVKYVTYVLCSEFVPTMLRQYFLELRVSFDNNAEEKEKFLLQAVRKAARELITAAELIADSRKPSVSVHSTDMFQGTEEIKILDEDEAQVEDNEVAESGLAAGKPLEDTHE